MKPILFMVAIAAMTLLWGNSARSASFDPADSGWEGLSEFVAIAQRELGSRVRVTQSLHWSELSAADGVLVIHPMSSLDSEEASDFMNAGGRLAVIDDFGNADAFLPNYQIERISSPTRPVNVLRNNPALAIAEPMIEAIAGRESFPHPVAAGVDKLVTNHASGLRHPNLTVVFRIRAVDEPDVAIGIAGQVGKGRIFVLSDPSILMNLMMRYPAHRTMSANLIRYLVQDAAAKRTTGRLWIVTNAFESEGSFENKSSVIRSFKKWTQTLIQMVQHPDQLPNWVLRLASMGIFAILLLLAVRGQWWRKYSFPIPSYARPWANETLDGVSGRLLFLGAKSSPRSLVLLQFQKALFAVAEQLGSSPPSYKTILKDLETTKSLDSSQIRVFRDVVLLMQKAEQYLLRKKSVRVSERDLVSAAAMLQYYRQTLDGLRERSN